MTTDDAMCTGNINGTCIGTIFQLLCNTDMSNNLEDQLPLQNLPGACLA